MRMVMMLVLELLLLLLIAMVWGRHVDDAAGCWESVRKRINQR